MTRSCKGPINQPSCLDILQCDPRCLYSCRIFLAKHQCSQAADQWKAVLDFWFGPGGQEKWFGGGAKVDKEIQEKFGLMVGPLIGIILQNCNNHHCHTALKNSLLVTWDSSLYKPFLLFLFVCLFVFVCCVLGEPGSPRWIPRLGAEPQTFSCSSYSAWSV